ncbi:MAG: response regulator [Proteobacteria bacterium]|nr:response regulator [Pseudomonadota bacterium]
MACILVVDDEVDVGEAIQRVLEQEGFVVTVASGVAEGLKVLETGVPDVVVTDMIMPKVNGLEFIKILRSRFPKVRIVAISGGGNPIAYKPDAVATHAYLAAASAAGAEEILTKPFDMDDLLAAVRRQLLN